MIKNDEGCYECMAHCSESHISVPCDSRHCDYEEEQKEKSKSGRKHVKDSTELSGGVYW